MAICSGAFAEEIEPVVAAAGLDAVRERARRRRPRRRTASRTPRATCARRSCSASRPRRSSRSRTPRPASPRPAPRARASSASRARSAPSASPARTSSPTGSTSRCCSGRSADARHRAPRCLGRAAREHAAGVRAGDRAGRRLRRVRRPRRPRGTGSSSCTRRRRIGHSYPSLESVLDLCRGRIGVMVELKRPWRYRRHDVVARTAPPARRRRGRAELPAHGARRGAPAATRAPDDAARRLQHLDPERGRRVGGRVREHARDAARRAGGRRGSASRPRSTR